MRPSSEVGSQFFVNKLKITWSRVSPRYPGADPGFWFGRGTGTRSGRRKSPRGVQGQTPRGGLGDKSPEVRRMLHQEAKYTYGEKKNKSTQTDSALQCHNYHHLIHSSFYVSRHFCLKIQKYKTQRNGPQ